MNVQLSPDDRLTAFGIACPSARHHEGEDTGAFPVIAQEHPELRPVLDELRRDHELIAEALTGLTEPDAELETLAALLETHLFHKEKKLVNALGPAPCSQTRRT